MTLEEAIKREEEIADVCEYEANKYDISDSYESYVACKEGECAEEHRQIAEWLKELKQLKKQKSVLDKVRTEIEEAIQEETVIDNSGGEYEYIISKVDLDDVLAIIDKYRTESEVE